jgi:hypothetical protein
MLNAQSIVSEELARLTTDNITITSVKVEREYKEREKIETMHYKDNKQIVITINYIEDIDKRNIKQFEELLGE